MEPDDNFKPPLDGLSRGNKINQILTALQDTDYVKETKYLPDDDDSSVMSMVDIDDIVDDEEPVGRVGVLLCNWWNMRRTEDWWNYIYAEIDLESAVENDSGDDEDDPPFDVHYVYEWIREENEEVAGLTYVKETSANGITVEPFDPKFDTPKPLTRAILDTYLPQNIRNRLGSS